MVPLLLSGGYHVHVDIAGAVAGAPGAVAARPLGPDPRLVEVLHDRLLAAGADPTDLRPPSSWRRPGSSDAAAVADVEATARCCSATGPGRDHGYGSARSRWCRRRGRGPRGRRRSGSSSPPTCSPRGTSHDKLAGAGADVVTAPLLPDDRIAAVLLDRYDAALRREACHAPQLTVITRRSGPVSPNLTPVALSS